MSLQFNSSFYLEQYPDVAAAGIDPQVHFENYGAAEGRAPNATLLPVAEGFDEQAYLDANSDVAAAVDADQLESGYQHWVLYGRFEDSRPEATFNSGTPVSEAAPASIEALFNAEEYLELNPDVAEAGIDAYEHFVNYGSAEGRAPNAAYAEVATDFNAQAYRDANPDIDAAIDAGANFTPYQHWVLYGQFEASRPEATLNDGRTVSDVLGGEEAVAPTFRLTEGSPTQAVAASDATASEYQIEAASATFGNAATFSVMLPEAEEALVVEIDPATITSGNGLATKLNADTAFDEAGLEASYANGVLTITDTLGRELSGLSLTDAGNALEESTASIKLLQSTLLSVDTIRVNIGGEDLILRGIDGSDTTTVVADIKSELEQITDAEGNKPYANIKVAFDGDTLTLSDDKLREFTNLTLLSQGEASSVKFTVGTVTAVQDEVAQLVLTLDGDTQTIPVADVSVADNTTLAGLIETAFNLEAGSVSAKFSEGVLTITDTEGRPFGVSSQLLNDGDDAVASVTRLGPLTDAVVADEVGQISITVGDQTVELANVDPANMTALAQLITDAFDADVTATVDGDEIVVTDAAGRGISNVYIGEAITAEQVSTAEISGLTDVTANLADTLTLKVGGEETLEVTLDETTGIAGIKTDLDAALLTAGLNGDVTVTVEGQSIIITDARGRQLSEVALTDTDSDIASSATIGGLTDGVEGSIALDLGYVEVAYNNAAGEAQDPAVVQAPFNAFSVELPAIADLADAATGDTLTVSIGGTPVTFTAANNSFDGVQDGGATYTLSTDGTTVTVAAEATFTVNAGNVTTDFAAREVVETEVVEQAATQAAPFTAELPAIADLADAATGDTLTVSIGGTPVTFTAANNSFDGVQDGSNTYKLSTADTAVTIQSDSDFTVDANADVTTDFAARTTEAVDLSNGGGDASPATYTVEADFGTLTPAADDTLSITIDGGTTYVSTYAGTAWGEFKFDTGTDGVLDGTAPAGLFTLATGTEGANPVATVTQEATFTVSATELNDGGATKTATLTPVDGGATAATYAADVNFGTLAPAADDTLSITIDGTEYVSTYVAGETNAWGDFTFNDNGTPASAPAGLFTLATGTEGANPVATVTQDTDFTVAAASSTVAARTTEVTAVNTDIVAAGDFSADLPEIADIGNTATGDELTVSIDGAPVTFTAATNSFDTVSASGYTLAVNGTAVSVTADSAFTVNAGNVTTTIAARGDSTQAIADAIDATGSEASWASATDFVTALQAELGATFTVEYFAEDGSLVIQGDDGQTITSVSTLTKKDGVLVGSEAAITAGVEREDGDTSAINLGSIAIDNSEAAGNQALVGVDATLEAEGSVEGINAEQVGSNAAVTDATEAEVANFGKSYFEGVVEGSDAGVIGTFAQVEEGVAAVEGSAWTATFAVDLEGELAEDYTFNLSLTEVLGEDAAEGAEAAVFNFSVDAVAGETSADVLANMVAAIDADAAFAAELNEEGQLVVTAADMATNYTIESGVELVGAQEEAPIVEAA
ncbi:hypothetical protein VRRI112168_19040 [Vreelandella rituensis]|uniref:Uncharacterized protein n=1 Tax=Vreelandella rituensis TaxID=2282306 RepID=A0A368TNQ5_9GAMM|nr:hypothetical protein [Halomonas rituensis]RCV85857.1 hypothetical protein DU506_19965 [Halomonas rituensis]